MKKLSILIALFVALIAGVALAFDPPDPNSDNHPDNHPRYVWTSTPEAQARTAAGDCPGDDLCKELCEVIDGEGHPTGSFACFPPS